MPESFSPAEPSPFIRPSLSPAFERARKLSRAMAVIFTLGFWLTLATTVLILSTPLVPFIDAGGHNAVGYHIVGFGDLTIPLDGLSVAQCAWVALAFEIIIVPLVFLMHHARRLFGLFARGEVFSASAIAHIRAAGSWLVVSFFAPIAGGILLVAGGMTHSAHSSAGLWPLGTGVVTYIAAYVMAEARRIADENASIV